MMLKHILSSKKGQELNQKEIMILKYNIGIKKIHEEHIKLLNVVGSILYRVEAIEIEDTEAFARATTVRTKYEEKDSVEELFKRRMGLRNYLKLLKMHMGKVKDQKKRKAEEAKLKLEMGIKDEEPIIS
jgi:hypothetical protein